ncbi:lipoprotein LpqH [Segniliparus rugosus]|uniref:Lipoprotein antigen n=1 Tax=Segniliparus rugosus (strain ATCC BAA-974 / DSM 45345 / CCUG 50838 / CIP 108380 / JCM 13579 / CDC 945) TaxID=679197 RepID=E5XUE2_SEGRC|nr:lipoprotein LpqH [Segniliparus rugosus]EFV12029.1 hypothetical protein HMPREF9336_03114 [Segniliparus rugosus ATCC BAA-974]
MMINSSTTVKFVASAMAAAACGALATGCNRGSEVTHTTLAGQAIDATQHGTKIAATLDGKSLSLPGPYTCGATQGLVTATSAIGQTPSVLLALKQGTTDASMITITPEQGKSYTWAAGTSQGNVSVTKSGDTYTATGKLPEMAFDSSSSLHEFKVEATCPGIK